MEVWCCGFDSERKGSLFTRGAENACSDETLDGPSFEGCGLGLDGFTLHTLVPDDGPVGWRCVTGLGVEREPLLLPLRPLVEVLWGAGRGGRDVVVGGGGGDVPIEPLVLNSLDGCCVAGFVSRVCDGAVCLAGNPCDTKA